MAEIVNLNKFKKSHKHELKDRQAVINRFKYGQTKVEKAHNKYEAQRENIKLEGKHLSDDGPDIA